MTVKTDMSNSVNVIKCQIETAKSPIVTSLFLWVTHVSDDVINARSLTGYASCEQQTRRVHAGQGP